jgi:hypothetical protein
MKILVIYSSFLGWQTIAPCHRNFNELPHLQVFNLKGNQMLKSSLMVLFFSLFFSSVSSANMQIVNCDSLALDNQTLSLVIFDSKLKQIRLGTEGALSHAFMPQLLHVMRHVSMYKIMGSPSLMYVDNAILQGSGGQVRIEGAVFRCEQF